MGSSRLRHVQVVYNEESRVSDLRHYISDSQFTPTSSNAESKRISTKYSYDTRGLLTGFGNWKYLFDEDDGLLVERGLQDGSIIDSLEYDSKGLLRWVERRVSLNVASSRRQPFDSFCTGLESVCYPQELGLVKDFSVQFVYDVEDRLIVVRNTLTIDDMVQYFYADPEHRSRLTGMFHHGRGKAYFFTYEQESGHLFAIEETELPQPIAKNKTDAKPPKKLQSRIYLIISDDNGSPIALFDSEKKVFI